MESTTLLDDLPAFGGLFGVYFFAQAFGYARGAGLQDPSSIQSAIGHGAAHLGNIFRPWADTAWPLTPFLCGILILLAPFIPDQSRRMDETHFSSVFFAALFGSTTLAVIGHAMGDHALKFSSNKDTRVSRLGWSLLYLASIAGLTLFGFAAIERLDVGIETVDEQLVDATVVLTIAWLIFVSYVGAEFDGKLDRRNGVLVSPTIEAKKSEIRGG